MLTTEYVKANLPASDTHRPEKYDEMVRKAKRAGSYAQCIKFRFTEEFERGLNKADEHHKDDEIAASPWACGARRSLPPVEADNGTTRRPFLGEGIPGYDLRTTWAVWRATQC